MRTSVIAAVVLLQLVGVARAQDYPARPVRMINPFAPGGPVDVLGRLVAGRLFEAWGQPVIVDNRPSAGGAVAGELVARARPDGYTLLVHSSTFVINAALYPKLPYDTGKDFAPVSQIAFSPGIIVAHPSLPVKSVRELIAMAKKRPGELNYASAGNGTPGHLAMEILKKQAGIDIVHIPYKGAGPAVIDLVAGQVQLSATNISAVVPHVNAGRLRGLAVTSLQRWPSLPDVATVAEDGVPGYEAINWYAIFAPARTPAPVLAKINADVSRAVESPEITKRFAALGVAPAAKASAPEFAAFVRSELAKWGQAVRASGIKPD
jgi:tripartite-type tricarboxylate transporter receptor subunit TctC